MQRLTKVCFENAFQVGGRIPQGLKPAFLKVLIGMAKAVPYPKLIYETCSRKPPYSSTKIFLPAHICFRIFGHTVTLTSPR